jgi:molecular chaperone HscA
LDPRGNKASQNLVLCLDFGTAKSKAFAGIASDDPLPDDMIELGLGRRDHDPDGSVYGVSSSVWISDEGLMFAGSEALVHSQQFILGDKKRRRLDSIKQELNLSNFESNLQGRLLEAEINPTAIDLSYQDALCFFLGYLTDLATSELASRGYPRNVRRRFTVPCWRPTQREWASAEIHRCLKRAQILADTFHGKWRDGIHVAEFKAASSAASQYESKLSHLIDESHQITAGGILEPLAAGSGRFWADRSTRNLVLVLDVGAGTTDFSLFWVVQDSSSGHRRAFPVHPCNEAVRMAGDTIDDILLGKLVASAHGHPNDTIKSRIATDLRLRGLRRMKEQLFKTGRLEVRLVTDQTVTLERNEFENSTEVRTFSSEIRKVLSGFLSRAHESWTRTPGTPMIVLTGGSAGLPLIQSLATDTWKLSEQPIRFARTRAIPQMISDSFDEDFQREYPQLAVAIGGVLPLVDEKSALSEWQGGSQQPGALEKFAITGR